MILRGEPAAQWFELRGFEPLEASMVTADELERGEVLLRRLWHSAASFSITVPAQRVVIVLHLDGELHCGALRSGAQTVAAGDSLVFPPGQTLALTAAVPSARIEIELPAERALGRLATEAVSVLHLEASAEGWARGGLVSLANIALNLGADAVLDDVELFVDALRNCADALVRSAAPPLVVEPWSQALTRRAEEVIRRRRWDPRFSVAALARELGITTVHLTRALRAEGRDTPGRVIREHRREAALALLREQSAEGFRPDLDELARRAGFGSTDTLRRVLKQAGWRG